MSNVIRFLTKKKLIKNRKGDQGITAAIILIAFVIIASLIAYVVLNLGQQFSSQTQTVGENAKNFAYVVQQGNLNAYDKYTYVKSSTQQSYDQVVSQGSTSTGVSIVSSNTSYYSQSQKSAYDTFVFEVMLPTTATGTVDFTQVRVKMNIVSNTGTHNAGGEFEFTHNSTLDNLGADGTPSLSLTTSSTSDMFGYKDMTGNNDTILNAGETFRVTLLVDMFAMGHGYSNPHELNQSDQFEITVFIGSTQLNIGPYTVPTTVEANYQFAG